jgi:hypothetical protein
VEGVTQKAVPQADCVQHVVLLSTMHAYSTHVIYTRYNYPPFSVEGYISGNTILSGPAEINSGRRFRTSNAD